MKFYPLLLLGVLFPLQSWSQGLDKRYDDAVKNCLQPVQKQMEVKFTPAPSDMVEHYRPSYAQRASFHLYRGIFDEFGGVIQGMLSGQDEANVKPYLRTLGAELKNKSIRENLTTYQSICVASCIINNLLESDEGIVTTTSMELAVARGRGFCRHFLLAMDEVLKAAKIPSKYGYSWDHIFFYFQHQDKKVIFDPGTSDGVFTCEFYDEV